MAVTKAQIQAWLQSQYTDMDGYDPRGEMEDGEHIFGAIGRRQQKEKQNEIVLDIAKRLKVPIKTEKYFRTMRKLQDEQQVEDEG